MAAEQEQPKKPAYREMVKVGARNEIVLAKELQEKLQIGVGSFVQVVHDEKNNIAYIIPVDMKPRVEV